MKKPALEPAQLVALRQDLALRTLWIPLQQAAERALYGVQHGTRGYAPMFDARFDGRGAAFMGVHTRMIAAPEERELSVGFPSAWTAVLKARYRALDAGAVDATALMVLRLMCEAPVQLLDAIMCALGAELVHQSGCRVYEAVKRCYFLLERVLATGIKAPAYDLGEMALWVWGQRYVSAAGRWELALYHELGLPYSGVSDDYYVPQHIWPPSGDLVIRTELRAEWDEGSTVPALSVVQMSKLRAGMHVHVGTALVYYSVLEWLHDNADFMAFGRMTQVCLDTAALARWILRKRDAIQQQGHTPSMLSIAHATPFGTHGIRNHQARFILAANAAHSVLGPVLSSRVY